VDVVLVPAGGGEPLGSGPGGMRILEDGSNTGHRIGIVEGSLPPGGGGPPQHSHREHTETFYVVAGTVRFISAGEHVDVTTGGLVTAPIGVPHTFSNPDPEVWATFMCTVAPDRYVDYFRELTALGAESRGGRNVEANLALMARYATEPYRPSPR